jgi:hypothetical protein
MFFWGYSVLFIAVSEVNLTIHLFDFSMPSWCGVDVER